mmetsp:Transcript_42687/g.78960  ORF Transcript_42687/g.78960 Transcript_42687/m.78960 type:complete len:129 (-) Transcript_42687:53-439(-)
MTTATAAARRGAAASTARGFPDAARDAAARKMEEGPARFYEHAPLMVGKRWWAADGVRESRSYAFMLAQSPHPVTKAVHDGDARRGSRQGSSYILLGLQTLCLPLLECRCSFLFLTIPKLYERQVTCS